MNIGIILDPFGEAMPAGLARAALETTRYLISENQDLFFTVFVKTTPQTPLVFSGANWRIVVTGSKSIFFSTYPWQRHALDMLLVLTPVLPLIKPKIPCIVVALDFAYLSFRRGLIEYVRSILLFVMHWISLHRAHKIIAISHATASDVKKFFGISHEKVSVVHEGFIPVEKILENRASDIKNDFLSISVIKERKNILRAIEAFALFKQKYPNDTRKFLIVGKGSGTYIDRIKQFVKDSCLEDSVQFLGFVEAPDISALYSRSIAFLYPSLIEGFGMPILESMHAQIPVITSAGGATQEVAGDAALCVDPYSPEAIMSAMEHIVASPELRNDLIAKGLERVKMFSWEKTARAYGDILRSLRR